MSKLFFFFLLLLSMKAFSQDEYVSSLIPEEGNTILSLQAGAVQINPFESRPFIGLNARVMLSDYFSLNYNFNFGKDYIHIPVFGGDFWMYVDWSSQDDGLGVLLFLLFLPEGFAVHIPIHERATLSPYVNFMGTERFTHLTAEVGASNSFRGAYGVGAYLDLHLPRFQISPFVEYGGLYNFPVKNVRFGGAIGFIL